MTSTEHPANDETPKDVVTEEAAQSDAPDTVGAPEGDGPGGRAKALRERAQHAETRVADLEAELDGYRRAAVERYAGGMHDPSEVWHHHELGELLTDDGIVDTDAVDTALAELKANRPHLFRSPRRPAPDHSQGSSANPRTPGGDTGEQWRAVLNSG